MRRNTGFLSTLLLLATFPAAAHTGAAAGAGFAAGLAHPFGGLDHLLAMVAVGLWGAQLGGRAIWAVPGSFVAAMALGGLLGAGGHALPHVETGIAASVLVLGIVVAFVPRLPLGAAAALVALFAVFHGHAHGAELPEAASGTPYGIGFLLATAVLHAAGVTAAVAARPLARPVRAGGAAIAIAGLVFLIA